jgi:hypothetical protein
LIRAWWRENGQFGCARPSILGGVREDAAACGFPFAQPLSMTSAQPLEDRAMRTRSLLLVSGVLLVCMVMLAPIRSTQADSTYSTQGATITASLITHSDGTATITASVENTNPSAIQVSAVFIYPSADPNVSCGSDVYRACFVCVESGYLSLFGAPEGVPSCGQPIAPNNSGSWTNTIYGNIIQDGQGYQLLISVNNGNPVAVGTLDATSDSGLGGIPAFPFQPFAVIVLTVLLTVSYLVMRRARRLDLVED